jgi:hypothetical protein
VHFFCFLKFTPKRLLYFALGCELINVLYFTVFFYLNGYLPAPFVWDKGDTFMDFYNPLYWVIKDRFYTVFQSVYPPLNYYLLKLFTLGIDFNVPIDSFQLRNSKPMLSVVLCLLYLTIVWIVINIGEWKKIKIGHRLLIWLACIFSTPVLFAIERGNLIFFALLFLSIYLAAQNIWIRAIAFGLLVNTKPYFLLLLIQYLNFYSFDKKILLISIFTSAIIFIFPSIILDLNIYNFLMNYVSFSNMAIFSIDGMVALPNNLASLYPIKWILNWGQASQIPGSSYTFWFSLGKVISYIAVVVLSMTLITLPISREDKIILSIILIANFSYTTGGYIFIIYIILIPYLINDTLLRGALIPISLIFFIPIDWIPIPSLGYHDNQLTSYLGGVELENVNLWLAWGTIIRPIANLGIVCFVLYRVIIKNLGGRESVNHSNGPKSL